MVKGWFNDGCCVLDVPGIVMHPLGIQERLEIGDHFMWYVGCIGKIVQCMVMGVLGKGKSGGGYFNRAV